MLPVLLSAAGLSAITLDASFILLGLLFLLSPKSAKERELAMAGKERRTGNPGRRQLDHELWNMAKDADRKADQALDLARQHISTCEKQNEVILAKLGAQDQWRIDDLKFQRRILLGIVGTATLIVGQVFLKSLGVL